jgi:hypothetical protein
VQAMIKMLDLSCNSPLARGRPSSYPRPRRHEVAASPGATRLQSALAGWTSRCTAPRPAPQAAESITRPLITKLHTNPLL